MGILSGFINGLKKSFSGESFVRKINVCDMCKKPSFMYRCLKCETDESYRGWNSTSNEW